MRLLIISTFLFLFYSNSLANNISFTKEEKSFLKSNPKVTIGMMADFTPFTYTLNDQAIGYEHDLLKIISKRTGLVFEKKMDIWSGIYNAFKDKKVDMISSISYKKYREPFTSYTSSYYDIPIMIFVKDDFGDYSGLNSLKGKKVGVLKDVFYIKDLQEHGGMELVVFESYQDIIDALVFGKIDALIQNLTNINFLIKKNVYTNLKLVGELNLPTIKKEDLRFGINPDKPLLASIVQKALSTITKEEKEELVNKWIGSIKEYGGGHIELNETETAYIDTKTIKYCIDPHWMPFEGINSNGEHKGMSADYYKLFEKILKAKFEFVKTSSWQECLELIGQKRCDMAALSTVTEDRKKYLNFTTPYLEVPSVIATRVDVPFINELIELEGEKIGITKGYAYLEILREKYPSLDFLEVENIEDGLEKVIDKELFAYIDTLASIGYKFQTRYFGELKIAGKLSQNWKLSVAVRNDDLMLLKIMQKAINSISNELHRDILNKWVSIKYEKGVNYELVWKVATTALILISLVIYWNRKITKANKLLREAQKDIEEKNKELAKLAITDKLTNLYNRAKLDEMLQLEIDRSERFNHSFGIAIADIDHFKKVNDEYGHLQGDKVLIEIANILKNHVRKTDFVSRYGGEEFMIICPESDLQGISKLMDNIRINIENHPFEDIGNQSASFGITMFKKGDTPETITARADKALYKAKNGGRNKIESDI